MKNKKTTKVMGGRKREEKKEVVELVEIGYPQTLIHRADNPTDEPINTDDLITELSDAYPKSKHRKTYIDWLILLEFHKAKTLYPKAQYTDETT